MTETLGLRILINIVFWLMIFVLHRSFAPATKGLVLGGCLSWVVFIPLVLVAIFVGLYVIVFPGQMFLLLTGQLEWKQNIFVSLYQGQGARNNVLVSGIVDFVFWGALFVIFSVGRSSR
jgi:hypothetical protein